MKRLFALLFTVLLAACAAQAPLPVGLPTLALPSQWHVEREQAGQREDALLIVQREDGALRWSMMDPLGIPQARQRLVDGQWQADGLLPPNPQARELFAALLFALTPEAELARRYPEARQQGMLRQLGTRWVVDYHAAPRLELQLPGGLHYRISPLDQGNRP
ncbi:hypothetical protein [uncultured Pseudomonas sp.]|uniref:hypothetical protein n=1 Tax=uncultured Pseudomonas sp. TaxID=114707 RepID=UPI0025ED34AC|nr:hypothetical protein [uncultured Pseudomonas sp.]